MSEIDSNNVKKRIGKLEERYQECVDELNLSISNVSASEKKLLNCLQQLMPLQNSYLTGLIRVLQNQIEELKQPQSVVKTEHVPDNVSQPKVLNPPGTKVEVIDLTREDVMN
jgi:hypothetical protein